MTQPIMEHVVAGLLLLARIGDIGSTYLATPKLLLESNPVARKLRWPFAVMTLGVALLPYFMLQAGIVILTASLLVTASNFGKVWFIRTLGEQAYYDFVAQMAARSRPIEPLLFTSLSALALALIGGLLMLFYPTESQAAYWIGYGFVIYAVVAVVYGCHGYWRMRRAGLRHQQAAAGTPET